MQVLLDLQEGPEREAVRVRLPLRPHLPRPDARQDPRAPRHRQAAGQEGHTGTNCIKWVFPDNRFSDTIFKRIGLPEDLFANGESVFREDLSVYNWSLETPVSGEGISDILSHLEVTVPRGEIRIFFADVGENAFRREHAVPRLEQGVRNHLRARCLRSLGEFLIGFFSLERNGDSLFLVFATGWQFNRIKKIKNLPKKLPERQIKKDTVIIGYYDYLGTRQKNSHRPIIVKGQ